MALLVVPFPKLNLDTMGEGGTRVKEESVHRVDVAHENIAEQEIQIARRVVQRRTKRVDADRVLVVLVRDSHRGTQFHRVDRVRDVPTPPPPRGS